MSKWAQKNERLKINTQDVTFSQNMDETVRGKDLKTVRDDSNGWNEEEQGIPRWNVQVIEIHIHSERIVVVHWPCQGGCPHTVPLVCSSRSSSLSSSVSLPPSDHSGGVCECCYFLLGCPEPTSVCEFWCDSSTSIVLSSSPSFIASLVVFWFLCFDRSK